MRLLVKTHAFGDALLATPAVSALVQGGGWAVLAGPSTAEVWRRMPGIERVLLAPFPCPAASLPRLAAWSLRNRVRDVERSVVLHSSKAVRLWVRFLAGAPMTSGGPSPLGSWEQVRPLAGEGFVGDLYADIAGVRVHDHRPVFPVTGGEVEAASRMLGGGDWVAFAPGGGVNPRDSVPRKRWNPAGFAEVARWCLGRGLGVCLLGDSRDMTASAGVVGLCPGVLDLAGRTTLGEAAAVLGSCRAFLGADSGLAHLARSAGTPAVVLFGPTDPSRLYPPGGVVPVVSPAPCSPCYSNEVFPGCRSGLDCTGQIDPGLVRDRLEEALDARRDD